MIGGGERSVGGAVLLGNWWGGHRVVSCTVVIGGEGVVWVALCRWDWWGGRGVGGAVQLGLVGRASPVTPCLCN